MQCVQIKPLDTKVGDTPRYRVVLSDIHNFIQTMLASRWLPSIFLFQVKSNM